MLIIGKKTKDRKSIFVEYKYGKQIFEMRAGDDPAIIIYSSDPNCVCGELAMTNNELLYISNVIRDFASFEYKEIRSFPYEDFGVTFKLQSSGNLIGIWKEQYSGNISIGIFKNKKKYIKALKKAKSATIESDRKMKGIIAKFVRDDFAKLVLEIDAMEKFINKYNDDNGILTQLM